MSLSFPPEFVLFDLEYTSWKGSQERKWSGPGEHREVIQIGAIRVSDNFKETDFFLEYVRPEKNPKLSEFIMELTGITQEDIDEKGISYTDAFKKFIDFVGATPVFCWGKDIEVFEENNLLMNAPFSLPPEQFTNLKPIMSPIFASVGVDIKQYTSGTLIQAFGITPDRKAHNALNDMRNLLDAIRELKKRTA